MLFTNDQLRRLVEESLPADAKPGEKVIIATLDSTGAKAIASFNFNKGAAWELQWATQYKWTGELQTGAKVIVRWK